jgi:Sec-independent protein translocase protein TatA
MFGISFPELVVIILASFLILGPQRMVDVAYRLGTWLGKARALIKEWQMTKLDGLSPSSLYEPKIELNKKLPELEKDKNA